MGASHGDTELTKHTVVYTPPLIPICTNGSSLFEMAMMILLIQNLPWM